MVLWSFSLYSVMLNKQTKKNCEDLINAAYSKYQVVAGW